MAIQNVKAAILEAQDVVARIMGPALDIEPMDALLMCVRIAAGEVAYCTWKIEHVPDDEAAGPVKTITEHYGGKDGDFTETTMTGAELHIWIRARREAMDRLAKYSKAAIDAGVAQRQLDLAESAGDQLAMTLRGILEGLGLTPEQEEKAPRLVRAALLELEQGPAVIEGHAA